MKELRKETTSGKPPENPLSSSTPTDKKKPNGQYEDYWVLSKEEREKGFIRPLRFSYKHLGKDLDLKRMIPIEKYFKENAEEYPQERQLRYINTYGYVGFIPNTDHHSAILGRFVKQSDLGSGCGHITKMGRALAETYARNPKFYGSTFCVHCGQHFPVEEFVWIMDGERVGS